MALNFFLKKVDKFLVKGLGQNSTEVSKFSNNHQFIVIVSSGFSIAISETTMPQELPQVGGKYGAAAAGHTPIPSTLFILFYKERLEQKNIRILLLDLQSKGVILKK